jgi:hypothetical protein
LLNLTVDERIFTCQEGSIPDFSDLLLKNKTVFRKLEAQAENDFPDRQLRVRTTQYAVLSIFPENFFLFCAILKTLEVKHRIVQNAQASVKI